MAKFDETDPLNRIRVQNERAMAANRAIDDAIRAAQLPAFRGIAEIVNRYELAQPVSTIEAVAKLMEPPTHLSAVCNMLTAMERHHLMIPDFAGPVSFVSDAMKQMAQIQALVDRITAPSSAVQDMLRSQARIFESVTASVAGLDASIFSISDFSKATWAWATASIGLTNRMSDIGLLTRSDTLSARVLHPTRVFAEFAEQTIGRLAGISEIRTAVQLRESLILAEHQLMQIADAISGFVAVPDDQGEPDSVPILRAPFVQQLELLDADVVDDEGDTKRLTAISPTAQNVDRARRVLELVTKCNGAARISRGIEIFKPTNRMLEVYSYLPWLCATDRFRFGDVLDCLFFIFYEAAGQDSLRFLVGNGGPLKNDDCTLIWCIKHLRNKWLRHDPDHGDEKEIQNSWAQLAEKFRWLGMAQHPTAAHHFQQLQTRLLQLAEEFLAQLLDRLTLTNN